MDLDEMLRVERCKDMDELIFEPDPYYSLDAGTGLLSPISYALQRGILLRRENLTYRYWAAATRGSKMVLRSTAAATRCFTMVLFTASRRNKFVGGTCALPSAQCPSTTATTVRLSTRSFYGDGAVTRHVRCFRSRRAEACDITGATGPQRGV